MRHRLKLPVNTRVHCRLRKDEIENAHGGENKVLDAKRCVSEYSLFNQPRIATLKASVRSRMSDMAGQAVHHNAEYAELRHELHNLAV